MLRLLLVEDDRSIVEALSGFLRREGFDVISADGQKAAVSALEKYAFDAAILDVSLADGNGFSVCAYIKEHYSLPVIFLTASDDEYSVVTGLDIGADDYIAKPFRPRELISRIKSVLRRYSKTQSVVELGNVRVDTERGTAHKNGEELFLSALEYRLLLVFINNRGITITRDRLFDEIWSAGGEFVSDNTLSVYIKRLRSKIEDDPQNPTVIKTVRGIGYRLEG